MSFELRTVNNLETHQSIGALETTSAKLQDSGNPTHPLEPSIHRDASPTPEPTHLVMTNPFSEHKNKAQTVTSF